MNVNLFYLGAGIFMLGFGIEGLPSPGSIAKLVGGIVVLLAAFLAA